MKIEELLLTDEEIKDRYGSYDGCENCKGDQNNESCMLCGLKAIALAQILKLVELDYGKIIERTKWVQIKGKYFNDYQEVSGKVFLSLKDELEVK